MIRGRSQEIDLSSYTIRQQREGRAVGIDPETIPPDIAAEVRDSVVFYRRRMRGRHHANKDPIDGTIVIGK